MPYANLLLKSIRLYVLLFASRTLGVPQWEGTPRETVSSTIILMLSHKQLGSKTMVIKLPQ